MRVNLIWPGGLLFEHFKSWKRRKIHQTCIFSAILGCPEWALMMEVLLSWVSLHTHLHHGYRPKAQGSKASGSRKPNLLNIAFVGYDGTVGGRNPAPVDTVGSLSHYLQAFVHPRWPGGAGFLLSTVCLTILDIPKIGSMHLGPQRIPRPTSGLPIRSRRTRGVTLEPSSGRPFFFAWSPVSWFISWWSWGDWSISVFFVFWGYFTMLGFNMS